MLEGIGLPSRSVTKAEIKERSKAFRLFPEERAFVEGHYNELKTLYAGRYIAVLGKSILDSDPVFSLLAERVYKRFGYRRVYMPLIEEPRSVYDIPSPRIMR